MHPGEDYNCRCWAEPASEPPQGKVVNEPTGEQWHESPIRETEPRKGNYTEVWKGEKLGKTVVEGHGTVKKIMTLFKMQWNVVPMAEEKQKENPNLLGTYNNGKISLSKDTKLSSAITLIHESGHWLYDKVFLKHSQLSKQFFKALEKTEGYKDFSGALEKTSKEQQDRLLSQSELFARIFTPFMMKHENVDGKLKKEFDLKKNSSEITFWLDRKNETESIFTELEKTFGKIIGKKRKWLWIQKWTKKKKS